MLTREKFDSMVSNPNTVIKKILVFLKGKHVCSFEDLEKHTGKPKKTLIVHIRKSPYLEYSIEHNMIKLNRKGKDPYKYGSLFDNPMLADNIHNLVFSLLWHANNKLTFKESLYYVKQWSRMTGKNYTGYENNKNIFQTIKKEINYWLL